MFDILSLDTSAASEAGLEMKIRHPTTGAPILDSENKPVTITLLGRNSEKFRALQREIAKRNTERTKREIPYTDEDAEREKHEVLCAMTTGWSFDKMGDEEFPFNPVNVAKFYANTRWSWVTRQAYAWVLNEGNYLAL